MYSANHSLGEILQKSVFATRSAHQLQLEPLSGCNWRRSTILGGSTQYLQLGVYIDCNSNHCLVATEEVVQYQAGALSICKSKCISIATRTTVGLQLKGYSIRRKQWVIATQNVHRLQLEPLSGCNERGSTVSGGSTQYLQLRVYIDCNSPVTTDGVVQYQAESLSTLNLECTSIATRTTGCKIRREHLVFATRSVYQLQLEPLSGCIGRSSIVSGGISQYLQLVVYIDCNSNHCQVATEGLVQLQLNKHFNCNSSSTSIATQQALRLQHGKQLNYNSSSTSVATLDT
jgi:hypothetical protein